MEWGVFPWGGTWSCWLRCSNGLYGWAWEGRYKDSCGFDSGFVPVENVVDCDNPGWAIGPRSSVGCKPPGCAVSPLGYLLGWMLT